MDIEEELAEEAAAEDYAAYEASLEAQWEQINEARQYGYG